MAKKEQEVNRDAAVDFDNPEALEAEIAAMEAAPETKEKKKKKTRKPRVLTITVPEGLKAGDTFEYEVPRATRGGGAGTGGGVLAGVKLEDMTPDQLKIEYRNAKSVHYKQTKAKGEASPAAQERLDKVVARMEELNVAPTSRATTKVDANAIADLIKSGKVSVDDIQALLDN